MTMRFRKNKLGTLEPFSSRMMVGWIIPHHFGQRHLGQAALGTQAPNLVALKALAGEYEQAWLACRGRVVEE